ncbi:related to SNF5-component of SWI/SNF transcription activator complex [Fusarium fujikuroi]|nr:related to SNF5-component of SWI/SNF transcription activator complex [Fusarium fujikuroi]
MGNEQSAESPRGHRKLSKPPHCSQASAAGLPYTATAVTPHREHFSNSYLVGSLPPAPNKASTTRRVAPGLGIAVPAGDASSPIQSPTCRDPMRDLESRTRSIQSEQPPILPACVNSSRTSSIAQDSSYRTLTRADSMPVAVRRGSASYDTRAVEAKKHLNAKEKLPSEPVISKSNKHSDEASQDVTDDNNNATQSAGSSISRTNSDVSLYMPMRRRSVVQTPGIATRAHHSNPPVSAKSSFRKSLPATPSQSRHNSIESGMGRRMSMPTKIPSQAKSSDRAVTPVEADYKQLGGMKFGSLRITNGAPGTSPMPEDDVKQQGASESALAIPRSEYFHEQAKNPLRLMNQGSTMTDANELTTGEKSLTSRVASCVTECLSDAEKSRTGDGGMSGNGNAVSFPVAEVLEVREDPNAKPYPKKMQLGLENKMLKGLSRSDSGFIPSPSSEKTHRSASRVDSGYSSNVSLRSLPSLRSGVTDKNTMASEKLDVDMSGMCSPSDSNSTRTSSLVPSQTHNRLPIHLEVPLSSTDDDTSSTCPTSPSSPASRPFSPFSRGSRMRLSLKSNKSFEPRVSNTATAPIVLSKGDFREQLPSPAADVSRDGSKIYRFLNGSRKKRSLKKGEVTTIEQDVTTDPLGLKTGSIPKPNRPLLRKEPSKDTLHTILSVGSQDAIGSTRRGEDVARGAKKTVGKKMSRRQSWRQSIAQLFGTRSADASPALSSIPEPAPTPKRPSTAMELTSRPFNAAPSPRGVSSWSSRPAPRKAASSSGSLALETRKMANKSSIQESRDKPELAHLRTNVSTPSLSAKRRSSLSPSALEVDQTLRTKTSPPVSMQNRGSKPPKAKSQAQNRAMTPSFPINSRPSASRRLSLPQDYGRMTPHIRQISHSRSESRSSSRGMVMSPTAGLSSQQVNAVQHSRVLSYSSNGTQQSGPAAQQVKHHRRVSAPAQPHQIANMPRSRSSTTLIQIQQQQMLQQHQQRRPRTSVQSWAPMDMHSLNQQLQQNYMMQNQALVYGAPNMVQQYPNIYVTSPVPNHPVHGRQGSQGGMYVQDPPFRVLHSYNSPAYRNVPIWSQ